MNFDIRGLAHVSVQLSQCVMIERFLLQPYRGSKMLLNHFCITLFPFSFSSLFPHTFFSHSIISSHILNFPSANYPLPYFSYSFSCPPTFSFPFSPLFCPHPSIRSWRSVCAIITMQSYSLSEKLTARALRRWNSIRNKSFKPCALNWRMRAKPCWVSYLCERFFGGTQDLPSPCPFCIFSFSELLTVTQIWAFGHRVWWFDEKMYVCFNARN